MSAVILTFTGTIVTAGCLWLLLGSRLALSEEVDQNSKLNLVAYFLGALPVVFVLVFFGIGG